MIERLSPILEIPCAYQMWNHFVGADWARKQLVKRYICPGKNDKLLDIGCGPGSMVPYLPEVEYVGFDSNSEYIAQAQKRFPRIRVLCSRVNDESLLAFERFDIAIAIGVVHHLEDFEASQLFRLAHQALKEGGRLITLDGVWVADQSSVAKFLLKRDRGRFVRNKQEYMALASQSFSRVNATVRHDMLRIPYSHLILECAR